MRMRPPPAPTTSRCQRWRRRSSCCRKLFAGGGTSSVGTGTLSLSLGGTSFSVTIDSSNDTLAGIASAINSASGNPGITASVLQGTDGAHLVLSSSLTGAANTIQVTETDGGNGLAAPDLRHRQHRATTRQQTAAQDAAFSIAGVAYTSPSNTVSRCLSGVTLNLLGTTAGYQQRDADRCRNDTSTIVSQHSGLRLGLQHAARHLAHRWAATMRPPRPPGPMLGNALLSNIQNQIQRGALQRRQYRLFDLQLARQHRHHHQ